MVFLRNGRDVLITRELRKDDLDVNCNENVIWK